MQWWGSSGGKKERVSSKDPRSLRKCKDWAGVVICSPGGLTPTSGQDKALECLDRLLLQSIQHHSEGRDADGGQALAWAAKYWAVKYGAMCKGYHSPEEASISAS